MRIRHSNLLRFVFQKDSKGIEDRKNTKQLVDSMHVPTNIENKFIVFLYRKKLSEKNF